MAGDKPNTLIRIKYPFTIVEALEYEFQTGKRYNWIDIKTKRPVYIGHNNPQPHEREN